MKSWFKKVWPVLVVVGLVALFIFQKLFRVDSKNTEAKLKEQEIKNLKRRAELLKKQEEELRRKKDAEMLDVSEAEEERLRIQKEAEKLNEKVSTLDDAELAESIRKLLGGSPGP